ncbi:IclR family transcriptional regulator [Streptomyces sioyaensis]|uniref:IclR family transcriptional regulator n=1 Tax=Streptomyces sioyaensis TaxID=67364 RepID=UPI00378F7B8B
MAEGPMRGLRILESMSGMEQPVNLRAVAARVGLSQSQTFRILKLLEEEGYVDHLGRSGYRLGSRAVALSFLLGPRPPLLRVVQPVVARLAATTAESAAMHLRSGDHRVLVAGIPKPNSPLRETVTLGERAPLTSGCGGLVILAHLPAEQQEAILTAQPATERYPSQETLSRIREQGHALSFGENHPGVWGIAVALLDPTDGTPLGSLTVAALEEQLTETRMSLFSGLMHAARHELAPRLAALLGPHSRGRLSALDVTVQELLHTEPIGKRGV